MPHRFGSRVTWGGQVKVLALFRWVKVYGSMLWGREGFGGKRGWALLGAVRAFGLWQKSQIELYMQNREHERMILESVENSSLIWPTIEENGVTRTKKYAELFVAEKIQIDYDMKVLERVEVYYECKEPFKSLKCLWVRSKSIATIWLEKMVTPLIDPSIKGFAAASAVLKPEHLKVDKHVCESSSTLKDCVLVRFID
nr:hypothetical protein [Tanacetum cinerariifolium]